MNCVNQFEKKSIFTTKIGFNSLLFVFLLLCVLAVFVHPSASVVLGPVMAICMFYLYFSGYAEIISVLILVANDALGTIVFGSVSFTYLLLLFTVIRLLNRKLSSIEWLFLFVAAFLQAELLFVGFLNLRSVIFSMTFILSLCAFPRDQKTLSLVFRGFYIAVLLLALHACITGGVRNEYLVEMSKVSADVIVRSGLLGIGIGDPNFSAFLLILGLICLWNDKQLGKVYKVIFSAAILWSFILCASVAGFFALLIVALLSIVVGPKKQRVVVYFVLFIIFLILLYNVYLGLPEQYHLGPVDGFLSRLNEKFSALRLGDYETFTTERVSITSFYFDYIFEQSIFGFLFGGNTININDVGVPHNSYISLFLQIGLVGFVAIFSWFCFRFYLAFKLPLDSPHRTQIILLKSVCLFFALTLSYYDFSLWAIWLYVLMLL